MFSICNTLQESISHFSDLLCEDTRFKHLPVCWFHLLLPSSGTRRHSAFLFPTSLSPSHSCFYRSVSYVSSYQSLVLYLRTPPDPTTPSYAALLPPSKLFTAKLATVTMTHPELSLPNYQPLLKYLSWTGTQLKNEKAYLYISASNTSQEVLK